MLIYHFFSKKKLNFSIYILEQIMPQGNAWKSCTGACMDITSPAKYFCVNCENHDSTYDVIEEEFEIQHAKFYDMYLAELDTTDESESEFVVESESEFNSESDEFNSEHSEYNSEYSEYTAGEFEDEFEEEFGEEPRVLEEDQEENMYFMEEQMDKWIRIMGEEIDSDLADAREEIATQVIHHVSCWHLGIKRKRYSDNMDKLREAMSQIMFESSVNKMKYLS